MAQLRSLYGDVEFTVADLPYPELHGGASEGSIVGGAQSSKLRLKTFLDSTMARGGAVPTHEGGGGSTDSTDDPSSNAGLQNGPGTKKTPGTIESKYKYIFAGVERTHSMARDVLLPGVLSPLKYFEFASPDDGSTDAEAGGGGIEIYVGPAGSGAQPHHHSAAYNALLRGRKRWFLWPHVCQAYGYVLKSVLVYSTSYFRLSPKQMTEVEWRAARALW